MGYRLIINYCDQQCQLSVCLHDQVLAERSYSECSDIDMMAKHSVSLLKACELDFAKLDYFVVVTGPGRLNPVRISCVVCKTLAYAAEKRCVGISRLYAAAQQTVWDQPQLENFALALPARRGHLFLACYRNSSAGLVEIFAPLMIEHRQLRELLEAHRGEERELGVYCNVATQPENKHLGFLLEQPEYSLRQLVEADSHSLAKLASVAISEQRYCHALDLHPLYSHDDDKVALSLAKRAAIKRAK